ncbi:MAG: hypothetical protein IRY87_35925 [Acetobacteraceae bacterium]|nr:hypothetical protein [Acetobacteraceae bacterium]
MRAIYRHSLMASALLLGVAVPAFAQGGAASGSAAHTAPQSGGAPAQVN